MRRASNILPLGLSKFVKEFAKSDPFQKVADHEISHVSAGVITLSAFE